MSYDRYVSPLSERYASKEMQYVFSPDKKFKTWRRLWIALAETEKELGLSITQEQIDELKAHAEDINYEVAKEREKVVRHDVMSHVYAYGQQCPKAKGIIHLGATSCYVGDNTDIIVMSEALEIVRKKLINVIAELAKFADNYKNQPTLAFTHFQPAQPTTVGKRATLWMQEFLMDLEDLDYVLSTMKLLGSKGTTGTQASFLELFDGDQETIDKIDPMIAKKMGFEKCYPVSGQTYSRKVDTRVLNVLAGIAASAHKFSNDIRLLQHLKEVEEPFEKTQIGSSAMAYKRNPMRSERIASLSRYVMVDAMNPAITSATQWFERTLDDSANKRLSVPEGFLAIDGILDLCLNVVDGLVVYPKVIEKRLMSELPFMATENIMMDAVKAGGDRQELHERIRELSMEAGRNVKEKGLDNNLLELIAADPAFNLTLEDLQKTMKPEKYVGRASEQVDAYLKNVIRPLLEKNKEIRLKWQKRLEYIMIDEFQDIDKIQYQLMKVLCGYHKNLFIVGDPDQTIYSWRGADINYLLNFDKAFPDVKTIMMNENYRSTPQILSVCNSLIDKNKNRMKKDLLPMCHSKNSVLYYHGDTSEEESDWIADQIIKLHKKDISYKDITILYRAHYVTRTLEETLLKKKIPYSIYSGIQFFERMEVKDALSYLRMITYKDDLSFLRIVNVPKRNICKKRMEFLQAYVNAHHCSFYEALKECVEDPIFKGTDAKDFISLIDAFSVTYEQRTISEVLSDILDRSGYEEMLRTTGNQERLDNLAELKQAVYDYEISCGEEALLPDYLDHAAKGLEFPHVFLCALNEGIFPSKKTSTIEGMEEERRLAFVAMSRAMKSLFLSESHGKNFDGSTRYPSRFILDIDQKFLEYVKKPEDTLIAETKNYIHYSNRYLDGYVAEQTFQIGDKIIHNVFGQGRIKSILSDRNAYMIKFEQIETPRIISFRVPIKRA